jgi:hypothetical protein
MQAGMLWFDNDPQVDLNKKIKKAADYYNKKYGRKPTLCFVNPRMADKAKFRQGRIEVRTNPSIMPNHLWMGTEKPPTV